MPLHILTIYTLALIAGDLPRRWRTSMSLRKTLQYFDINDKYPGIYANWFVDKDGYPPTVAHMHELLEVLKLYIKDHRVAAMVDRQFLVKVNNQWAGRDGSGPDKERRRYFGGGRPGESQFE